MLSRLGHLDAMGHLSARVGAERVAVTPAYGSGAGPHPVLAPEEVAVVDLAGRQVIGDHEPTSELALHLAVYRARPETGAVLAASPRASIALAIAGRQLRPVTHGEAWIAHERTATVDVDGFISNDERARQVVGALGSASVCHVRGLFTTFVARDATAVVRLCHAHEYLARMNVIVADLTDRPQHVTAEDTAAVQAEKASEATMSGVNHADIFASFDDPDVLRSRHQLRPSPRLNETERIKRDVALTCRTLASRGTLVGFYEHVSQRLSRDRFAMCPAQNFHLMQPDDIAILSLDNDPSWLDGPHPPAPYRRFHRDVLVARSDVNAIVHTHEMFGRALAIAGRHLEPVFRNGLRFAKPLPTLDRPCMVFSETDRADALQELGDQPVVHILGHGTDYVAASLAEATTNAIHREEACQTFQLALRMGTPRSLSEALCEEILAYGPGPTDWWDFYTARAVVSTAEPSASIGAAAWLLP